MCLFYESKGYDVSTFFAGLPFFQQEFCHKSEANLLGGENSVKQGTFFAHVPC